MTRRTDDGTAVEAVDGRENDEDVIEIAEKKIDHHLAAAAVSEVGAQSGRARLPITHVSPVRCLHGRG